VVRVQPRLQIVEEVLGSLKKHRGYDLASTVQVEPMTRRFATANEKFLRDQGIPLICFPKGQCKDDVPSQFRPISEVRTHKPPAVHLKSSPLESRALESTARFANRQHVRLGITDRPAHFYKAADTAASNATRSRFPAGRQEKRQSIFRPQLLLHFSPG
jgi:hypothetical protein